MDKGTTFSFFLVADIVFSCIFASQKKETDSVAQLVEQLTLNQWDDSSNLSGVT